MSDFRFRLRHTMLPVRDLDRTIDFYTRLLGMDIMRLRRQDETTRVGYLGYDSEDEGPALELIQSAGPTDPVQIPPWAGHFASNLMLALNDFSDRLMSVGVNIKVEFLPAVILRFSGGSSVHTRKFRLLSILHRPFPPSRHQDRIGLFSFH